MIAQTMAVNAGPNMDICENHSPAMNASAANYETLLWSTSGDGTFSDNTILNPTYTPGPNDISSGSAELILEVSNGPNTLSDGLIAYISHLPLVYAGEDASYCEDISDILIAGAVVNTEEYEWTTSGNGYFNDPLMLETVYYPGANDIANGSVTLTLTGIAVAPCEDNISNEIEITFLSLPDVTFAAIDNFCHNSPAYELTEGSPSGGEYSGPNVIDGWFYPETAGVGAHLLTYTYEDANGCENFAEREVIVDDCTGIDETGSASVSITPNPGKGIFEMLISGFTTENDVVEIYNVNGKMVYHKDLSLEDSGRLSIDLSGQPDGIYYLYLYNGKFTFDEKIVIVR